MTTSKNIQYSYPNSALQRAIDYFGGVRNTAQILGVSRQAIYYWLAGRSKNETPPLKYCKIIEKKTNGEISQSELRSNSLTSTEYIPTPKEALKKGIALIKQAFNEIN